MTTELKDKFEIYHQQNPEIYNKFKELTLQVLQNRARFGAKAIIEQIRWNSMISGNEDFKISNNYTAYYARKFMNEFSQHDGLFKIKKV